MSIEWRHDTHHIKVGVVSRPEYVVAEATVKVAEREFPGGVVRGNH
jgi:hypothetical protein